MVKDDENALEAADRYFSWGGRVLTDDRDYFRACPDGVVVLTESLCLMARAVEVNEPGGVMMLPECDEELKSCNAWLIHFMAGDLSYLPVCVPDYLRYPLVCYLRGGRLDSRLRVIPIQRFSRHLDPISGGRSPY